MGGAGSGRLGLRRPDLFAGISLLGAGPMQLDFMEAPKGTDVPLRNRAALFEAVWGSDPAYYLAEHPWTVASQRAAAHVALCTKVRIGVGASDAMLAPNLDFHAHLTGLGVPHALAVVPGVGHDPMLTLQGLGEEGMCLLPRFVRHAVPAAGGPRLQRRGRRCGPRAAPGRVGPGPRRRRHQRQRHGRRRRPRHAACGVGAGGLIRGWSRLARNARGDDRMRTAAVTIVA